MGLSHLAQALQWLVCSGQWLRGGESVTGSRGGGSVERYLGWAGLQERLAALPTSAVLLMTSKVGILTQMFNKKGLPEVELCIIYVLFHHALW